uniref:O-methyltransferase domain-containing protein n=1 Tax=Leersia perrieri TaxID=77586 RepID=A0A0D9WJZ4_9ORYZ
MEPTLISQCNEHTHADHCLLDAQLELFLNTFAFIKSMALKSALDLRIADAIHHNGGAATLPEISTTATLHPSKLPCLRRLMRLLTISGVFTVAAAAGDGEDEPVYALTPASRLLVGGGNLASTSSMILHPTLLTPLLAVGDWLRLETPSPAACIFRQAHGEGIWELADRDAVFDAAINEGMACDSRFIMDVVVRENGEVFEGIGSLIDVGGGLGAAAQVVSDAFPEWVLHDWSDDECVKIIKNCKKAIPSREAGGKVIIMDIVVGAGLLDQKHREVQAFFDLYIMYVNGIERDEQEWKKVFFEAGFSGYKIMPVLGFRSIIEVYP